MKKEICTIEWMVEAAKKDLESRNLISALVVSLTIMDVLGKALFPKLSHNQRYKKVFDEYYNDLFEERFNLNDKRDVEIYKKFKDVQELNSDIVYQIRCAVLHEGRVVDYNKIKEYALKEIVLITDDVLLGGSETIYEPDDSGEFTIKDGVAYLSTKIETKHISINIRDFCDLIIGRTETILEKKNVNKDLLPKMIIEDGKY